MLEASKLLQVVQPVLDEGPGDAPSPPHPALPRSFLLSMQPGRRLIKGAPTFPGRSKTGGGADEGEARACFPWATECSHTQPKPWSAAH